MQCQECRTKAGGEGRGRLSDAALGTGQLGGEARQEVVLGLLLGQLGYRGQHAEGIGGQEDHLVGVTRFGDRLDDVLDVIDGVGDPGVFGFAAVIKIHTAVRADNHVFQQRIATDGVVDVRLGFLGELDGLGVAAPFEVEYAVVVPAVLVIADQLTLGIGGEGGLAGTGQAEEDGHVTVLTHVGRAVHGGDAAQGQQVVHHGEHPLLHLATVPGAADELDALGQVESDEVFRIQPLRLPVRIHAFRAVHHNEVRFKIMQFVFIRADKHVFDEVSLPGHLGNKADFQAGIGIGAAEAVHHKQAFAG